MQTILKKVEDINIEWLNKTILNNDNISEIDDYKIWYTGNTGVSTVVVIELIYSKNESHHPTSVFIKFAKLNKEGNPVRNGEKELYFYNKLSEQIGIKNIPKCIFADRCSDTNHFTIILENLGLTHDSQIWEGNKKWKQMSITIDCLAKIHTKWWNKTDNIALSSYKRTSNDCKKELKYLKDLGDDFINRNSSLFSNRILDLYKNSEDIFNAYFNRYLTDQNLTLIHRDCHHWNFMYPKDNSEKIYLIDWDTYRIDIPTNDLAYYIAVHSNPEQRKIYEMKLLELYHSIIVKNGITDYSFNELLNDYKLSVISMTYLSAVKEKLGLPPSVWKVQFENIINAIEDLDCIQTAKSFLSSRRS